MAACKIYNICPVLSLSRTEVGCRKGQDKKSRSVLTSVITLNGVQNVNRKKNTNVERQRCRKRLNMTVEVSIILICSLTLLPSVSFLLSTFLLLLKFVFTIYFVSFVDTGAIEKKLNTEDSITLENCCKFNG